MKREDLKGIGLTDEQIGSVMAMHGADINPLKESVTALTTERDSAKEQVTTLTGQLDQIQKDNKGNADLKAKIDELKEANDKAKKDAEASLAAVKLDSATKLALTQSGAKNIKAVEALLDRDALKLDDKGNLNGLDDQLKALKEADDSKFLFQADGPEPEPVPNTPTISVGGNPAPQTQGEDDLTAKIAARLAKN